MYIKRFLFLVLLFFTISANANFGVKKIPLNTQLEMAEAVGLVKLVEAKVISQHGERKQIELLFEVIDGIYNLEKGERHKLQGSGFIGNDIGFNCIGSEAIVIMRKLKAPLKPEGFYATIGFKESVLHKKNNLILGIDAEPVTYEEAVAVIKLGLGKKHM